MNAELLVFIVYLVFMVGIGVYFFLRSKSGGEKVTSWVAVRWVPGSPRCPPVHLT